MRTRRNRFDNRAAILLLAIPLALAGMGSGSGAEAGEAPALAPALSPALGTAPVGEQGASERGASEQGAALKEVQQRLWTAEQLRTAPEDARSGRVRPPDRSPPDPLPASTDSLPVAGPASADLPPAGSIRRVKPRDGDRPVALTFDLCERADEHNAYDGAVVDALRKAGAPATFFAGGKWMRTHPERTMQLMADPLFEVGNHAWTHGNLRVLGGERAEQQIAWPQQEYALLRATLAGRAAAAGVDAAAIAAIPAVPRVFRFPYGVCSKDSLQTAQRLGLASIQWDVISGDAMRSMTADGIVRTVLSQTRPGSVVVFHANGRGHGTAAAIPRVVEGLRGKGFRLVTVSELLRAGEPVAAEDCYELRPGDNGRYDRLFGEGTG